MNRQRIISTLLTAVLTAPMFGQTNVPLQSYLRNNSFVNFESPHVHPLDITPDGTKLLAVNTPNNSLEVYATNATGSLTLLKSIPVGLDPVTVRARTNSEAWVVNVISDSVSVVDLTDGIVTNTIQTNDEPADVVFPNSSAAYVSCAQAKTLLEFSTTAPNARKASIVITGEQPRAMAVDKTGRYIYLAIFESGNGTTILPGGVANGAENDDVRDPRGPYKGINVPPNVLAKNAFNPPLNPNNPAPIPVSIIVKRTVNSISKAIQWLDDNLTDWSKFVSGSFAQNGTPGQRVAGWDLVDRDVAIIDTTNNSVTYQGGLMNILMAIGVNPSTNEVTVVGTDATNQIRYEPVLDGKFVKVNFARFVPSATPGAQAAASISDLNPHLTYTSSNIAVAQRELSIGDPRGIVWSADGSTGYVTGMGSNNLIVISNTGARQGLINVGQGPTGIVVAGSVAWVLNKFDGTISTVALSGTGGTVAATTPLYYDPTPDTIKAGRPFLYNTQLTSGLGQASCASCHVDARWDRLAWDLGNPAGTVTSLPGSTNSGNAISFHPMKGPMLTQTLVDTMQAPALHWRGDRPVLEDFEGAFQTLMGADNPATQAQINALRNFLTSITLVPNPNRNLDNSYPTALPVLGAGNVVIRTGNAAAGAQEFEQTCRPCHPGHTNRGAAYIDTNTPFGVGIRNPPTWKNFYKRTGLWFNTQTGSTAGFGFQQDGTFDSSHNGSRSDNMMAFMMSFNGGYPYEPTGLNATNWSNNSHAAVGKQVTLSPSVPTDPTGLLPQLEALGDQGVIGLVAKGGVVTGTARRGWMYRGNGVWQSDHLAEVDSTATLNSLIAGGATITFTAVPNESAARIGIDMDSDGILDYDDAQPNVANASPVNLALTGRATAVSASDANHTAQKAIDGNTIGYFDQNSMLQTQGGNNDWFQEDLGVNAQINLIQLFNRWDCCASRLANVSVFISENPFVSQDVTATRAQPGVKEFYLSGVQGALAQIPMQTAGRYIRVQLNATATPLQLAEVRVMGFDIASFTNPGTQTSAAGSTVSLQTTLNSPTSGATYTYSAVNLPPGLSIDPQTGLISGTIASSAGSTYTPTITALGTIGAGAPSTTFTWKVSPPPGFTVSVQSSLSLAVSSGASVPVTIVPSNGFSGSVSLAITGLPQGVSYVAQSNSATSFTLAISSQSTTASGNYPLTITGTSGSLTATAPLNLTVTSGAVTAQKITFATIAAQKAGSSVTVSATASSGLKVSYTAGPASVCSVTGSTASFIAAGSCTITASQGGNSTFAAATPVSQVVTVTGVTQSVSVTGAALSLAPGTGGVVQVSISGLTTAPTSLGLGAASCINVGGCQYNLGGTSGVFGYEFLNVTTNNALLVVYVPPSVAVNNAGYSIPITIAGSTVGTLKLTVP